MPNLKTLIRLFCLAVFLAACNLPSTPVSKQSEVLSGEVFSSKQELLANTLAELEWKTNAEPGSALSIGLYQNGMLVQPILETTEPTGTTLWAPSGDLEAGSYSLRIAVNGELAVQKGLPVGIIPQTPWQSYVISNSGQGPDGVRLFDANRDGLLDITTAFEESGNIMLFLHPGHELAEQPWPAVEVGAAPRGEDALGADLDGDGAMDVISSHEGDEMAMYVHWAPADPAQYLDPAAWTTELLPASRGHSWMFAIMLDVNQDGLDDIVAGSKDDYFNDRNSVGDLGWFEAPAGDRRNLEDWAYQSIDHTGWTMSIIAHDLNQDGYPDLLVTDRDADPEHHGPRWLANPGPPWDEWHSQFMGDLAVTYPLFMGMGDLDGDGTEELAIPFGTGPRLLIIMSKLNDGELSFSTFEVQFETAALLGRPKSAEIVDVDMDGKMDIVLSFEDGEIGVMWLSYSESPFEGIWTVHTVYEIDGGKFDLVQLYDVDGDGDKDILSTEEVHNLGVLWFENPTIP